MVGNVPSSLFKVCGSFWIIHDYVHLCFKQFNLVTCSNITKILTFKRDFSSHLLNVFSIRPIYTPTVCYRVIEECMRIQCDVQCLSLYPSYYYNNCHILGMSSICDLIGAAIFTCKNVDCVQIRLWLSVFIVSVIDIVKVNWTARTK